VLTLYDAERCPYCARVRIVLAEKDIEYETVMIDLSDRPAWLYEKNPIGKVPVLEEDGFILPESEVINEYLEERYPEPALLPEDPATRALVRLRIERFELALGDAYYAFRRSEEGADDGLAHCLSFIERYATGSANSYDLADVAYVPWLIRLRDLLGFDLTPYPAILARLDELAERPAIAAEVEIVSSLATR
jgi:glutathione S-transferase